MRVSNILTLLLSCYVVFVAATAHAAMFPFAGFVDSRLDTAGGMLTIMAYSPEPLDNVEVTYYGSPTGVALTDDGIGGDMLAGDGVYTAVLPIGPVPELTAQFEIRATSSADPSVEYIWPYMEVDAPLLTPTPTPTPTETPSPTPTPIDFSICHPLSVEECTMPFPSSVFLADDNATVTGYRINLPRDVFANGNQPDTINRFDGFSRMSSLTGQFLSDVNMAFIPTNLEDTNATMSADAKFLVFDAEPMSPTYGQQQPFYVETRQNATTTMVLLRPADPLRPNHRYVVAMRNLDDGTGQRVQTSQNFADLRDGVTGLDPAVEAIRSDWEAIFTDLQMFGIDRSTLDLAWDFRTRSYDDIRGPVLSAIEQANTSFDPATADWQISFVQNNNGGKVYEAFLTGPSYLDQLAFVYDADGVPIQQGDQRFRLVIYVPEKVFQTPGDNPTPSFVFGHGVFSTPEEAINRHAEEIGHISIGVEWQGFSGPLAAIFIGTLVAPDIMTQTQQLSGQLMQSIVNATLIQDILPRLSADLEAIEGRDILDEDRHYYVGASLGGIVGGIVTAVHPDLQTSLLVVPGGGWSHLFRNSGLWSNPIGPVSFQIIIEGIYPDPVDVAHMLNFFQLHMDLVDPANYSEAWNMAPIGNRTERYVMVQLGVPDGTVPNLSSRLLLHDSGLTHLGQVLYDIPSLPRGPYPGGSLTFGGVTDFACCGHQSGRHEEGYQQAVRWVDTFPALGGTSSLAIGDMTEPAPVVATPTPFSR